jgi:hypothetical protein
MYVEFALMCGTNFQQAAGAWGAGSNIIGSSNQFNFMGSGSNVFELFDVGLYEGSVAPAFQVPDYASELLACRRYWRKLFPAAGVAYSTTTVRLFYQHSGMRTLPTVSLPAPMQITDVYSANLTQSSVNLVTTTFSAEQSQIDFANFTLTTGRYYVALEIVPVHFNARL